MRRSWLVEHAIDLALAALVLAAFGYLFILTRGAYFVGDDWGLLHQGSSLGGMTEPYNDHLSVTILAVYRVLVEVFGLTYWPFRAVGLICLMAVPVVFYATTRRCLGPPLAATGALALLGFASDVEINPALLNHYLTLLGAIACAAALNRDRADWILTGGLALALSATGGGVAVAAACVVHLACTRASRRRWLAVLLPCALWGVWWLAAGRGTGSRFQATERPSLLDALSFAGELAGAPFRHLAFGSPPLAAALIAAFIFIALRMLRGGLAQAANVIAWTAAFVVWSMGLAYERGGDAPIFYRYQLVATAFLLLAVVPRAPIQWRSARPARPWSMVAAACLLIVGVGGAAAVRGDVEARAERVVAVGRLARERLTKLEGLPDDTVTSGLFFELAAAEVQAVVDRYSS